jgi:hypothetical protein
MIWVQMDDQIKSSQKVSGDHAGPSSEKRYLVPFQRQLQKRGPLAAKPAAFRKRWIRLGAVMAVVMGGAGRGLYWWPHRQPTR